MLYVIKEFSATSKAVKNDDYFDDSEPVFSQIRNKKPSNSFENEG